MVGASMKRQTQYTNVSLIGHTRWNADGHPVQYDIECGHRQLLGWDDFGDHLYTSYETSVAPVSAGMRPGRTRRTSLRAYSGRRRARASRRRLTPHSASRKRRQRSMVVSYDYDVYGRLVLQSTAWSICPKCKINGEIDLWQWANKHSEVNYAKKHGCCFCEEKFVPLRRQLHGKIQQSADKASRETRSETVLCGNFACKMSCFGKNSR